MEILFKRNYGFELIFKAENVEVCEDVEERVYPKKEDGKPNFEKQPFRDVNNDCLEQLSTVLHDAIHYRERVFDSSGLIESLFDKLPEEIRQELLKKLVKNYEIEPEGGYLVL